MIHRRSGFAGIAPTLAILYLAALFYVLLAPFDFSSPFATRENSVAWPDGAKGVQFGRSGMLITAAPPADLYRRLTSGQGLTVELWLRSASVDQKGPARILSYSLNPWERNFTLGQSQSRLIVRFRTTRTDVNGEPSVRVSGAFVPGQVQHIVVTYGLAEERVYIDGMLRAASANPQGGFATWDPSYFLVFGNEVGGARPWDGEIAYAAIYDRPLPAAAVAARYEAGSPPGQPPADAGLLLAYDFAEGMAGLANGAGDALADMPRLERPARIAAHSRLLFQYAGGNRFIWVTSAWDLIRNVILFVPFGVFGVAFAGRRARPAVSAVLWTVGAAALVSAGCELLQYFQDSRTSSLIDVGTNTAGALLGAAGYWCWWLSRYDRYSCIR